MKEITKRLIEFRMERGWGECHIEPELARSVGIEAAELNELYQWNQRPCDERLAEEIADVMIYCLYLCEKRGFDPASIINAKIVKNAIKYPADHEHGAEKGWV